MSDFISPCLGFPICTYLLRSPCRINQVMQVLLFALHLLWMARGKTEDGSLVSGHLPAESSAPELSPDARVFRPGPFPSPASGHPALWPWP